MSYDAWQETRQGVDMDMVEKLSKRLEALEATLTNSLFNAHYNNLTRMG